MSHAEVSYLLESEQQDLNDATRKEWRQRLQLHDQERARTNLCTLYPGYASIEELAHRVAGIVGTERSRRNAHYYRYRALFNVPEGEPLLSVNNSYAEASLIDLHERTAVMTERQLEIARAMGGKGISLELGHVDQLGAWADGSVLDAQVRELPESRVLEEAGFTFRDTYGDKDRAKVSYKFYVSDHFEDEDDTRPHHISLKGVRKRAAADVETKDGDTFELVKMSSFLINIQKLTMEQRDVLTRAFHSGGKASGQSPDNLMNYAGLDIIEPHIADVQLRRDSSAVIAASSLYFALRRGK